MDFGDPISYQVLRKGTPVVASDGEEVGTVHEVLMIPEEDLLDGIVFDAAGGRRFVDAPEIDRLYERAVQLTLSAEEARALGPPRGGPGVFDDPISTGASLGWLSRLFGGGGRRRRG